MPKRMLDRILLKDFSQKERPANHLFKTLILWNLRFFGVFQIPLKKKECYTEKYESF